MLTLKSFKEYAYIEEGIIEKERKLEELKNNPPANSASKVKGSSKTFPYTERTFSTCGYGESVSGMSVKSWEEKKKKLEGEIAVSLDTYRKMKLEVESFLTSLEPDEHKIFSLFIAGYSQEKIGHEINLDQTWISRKMKNAIDKWNKLAKK